MAFISFKKHIAYLIDKSNGKAKWIKLGKIPPRAAQKALVKYNADRTYLRLGFLDDAPIAFGELVEEYLEDARRHKGAYTVKVEGDQLKVFLDLWKKTKAREISALEVEKFIHEKKYKPTTAKGKMIILSNVWAYGVRRGYFKENEMKKLRRPALETLPPIVVSERTIRAVIEKASQRTRPILEVLVYTACRPSEALKLKAMDIDLKRGEILFRHTKTKRSRAVPMAKKLVPILKKVLAGKKGEDDLFDETLPSLRYAFEEARAAAKVKERVFLYAFRHFALTKFLDVTGGDLRAAQQFAGHSQIQTTIRYTHRPQSVLKKGVDRL